jgi:zinc D-Ala-D-Ala dipeptidase
VFIRDIIPTIIENKRYLTEENFVGEVLDGYKSRRSILTKEAAIALSNAEQEFRKDGYAIVVYDSYRPQRAVDQFIEWAKDEDETSQKEKYYPHIDKEDLFEKDYICSTSGHSRGSTLDMTLIEIDKKLKPVEVTERFLTNGLPIPYLDDGTVDFGTSFDYFGESSNHGSTLVEEKYQKIRNYLKDVMKRHGFTHMPTEWWHYTLENEPFDDKYFDFVLGPKRCEPPFKPIPIEELPTKEDVLADVAKLKEETEDSKQSE